MKVGLVGLGFMGATHLQSYARIEEAEVVALCSSDPRKLQGELSQIQGNLDIEIEEFDFGSAARYQSFAELLADDQVEAVDLCVPTHLHPALAVAALEAGKHVLVEKPMALSPHECRQILEASRKHKRVLMVAQVIRFWPEFRAARQKVVSGELGQTLSANFERRCGSPAWGGWLRDPERSGGSVVDLLVHDFDFVRHLLGRPERISAHGELDRRIGIDLIQARLFFTDGLEASVAGGWLPPSYPFRMGFRIVCEKGTLEFQSDGLPLTLYPLQGEAEILEIPEEDGFTAELRAFTRACREEVTPEECPPEESAESVQIALAADQSRRAAGESMVPFDGN